MLDYLATVSLLTGFFVHLTIFLIDHILALATKFLIEAFFLCDSTKFQSQENVQAYSVIFKKQCTMYTPHVSQ